MLRHGVRSRLLTAATIASLVIPWSYVAGDEPPGLLPSGELEVRNVIPASDIGLASVTALEFEASTGSLLVAGDAGEGAASEGRRIELAGAPTADVPADAVSGSDSATAPDGSTYRLAGADLVLLDPSGATLERQALTELGIANPQAVALGPTADPTDGAAETSLYVADADVGVVELASAPTFAVQATDNATLINTIDAAAWSPPSPDTSGIAWHPGLGRLIVVDGEVEETVDGITHWQGANVWEITTTGSVFRTWNVRTADGMPAITNEPVGAAVNPTNGHVFISEDDGQDLIREIDRGDDDSFGTADDRVVAEIATSSTDAEGAAYGVGSIFVADGVGAEVWRIQAGPDGDFDTGDDIETHFDVGTWIDDPEGIEFDPASGRLLVLSSKRPGTSGSGMLDVTIDGSFVRVIGLGALTTAVKPSGLAKGPSGTLFITERGVDNNTVPPPPIDGAIYEVSIPPAPTPPPDTTITGGPADGATTTSTSAGFTFNGTPTPTSFECKLDSGTFAVCSSPKDYAGLAVGSHTFSVRAIGPGGTDATPATRTWTISTTPPPPPPPPPDGHPFTDINGHPFESDIVWLYKAEITGGCTSTLFCPNANVLRDQMASFLDRALELPPTAIDFFTDDEGNIHEAAINRLAAAGITGGCDVRQYCPKDSVLRDQMASFLDRAYTLGPTLTDFFTDDDSNIHEASINRLANSGITGGCAPGRYCPKASVTRGQMAAFLHRGDPFAT